MDSPETIALEDVVLRDDLDPRLGERDDDLIAQYADIFDVLPPIEINQHKELIDGWHRVRAAERAQRTEIAYVVVETQDDDDLADRMWAANLRHGVQYTRVQRQTRGLKLHKRKLTAQEIADRVGVNAATVRRWTKDQRERDRQQRNEAVIELAEQGKAQAEIAEETGVPQSTVSDILTENVQMREIGKDVVDEDTPTEESAPEPESEREASPGEEPEPDAAAMTDIEPAPDAEVAAVEEQLDDPESESEPDTAEASADEEPATPEPEPGPPSPEPIPDDILNTARSVMGAFAETQPDDYVARLEASGSEWMTITDDSLSNELERELLTSAAAMCLCQELMIWYHGTNARSFTDTFGKIGDVFVRGQSGQWSLVAIATSKLRDIMRRFL